MEEVKELKRANEILLAASRVFARELDTFLVETMGIEPTTPCLQSRCSSQLSYVPVSVNPTRRLVLSR